MIRALLCFIGSLLCSQPIAQQNTAPASSYQALALEKLATGHDVISASINGVSGLFIVDTGAVTVVNQRMRAHFKLPPAALSRAAAGAGGSIRIAYHELETFTLGGQPVAIDQVGSIDLDAVLTGLYNATGEPVDGLIGMDVLVALQARLDVANQRLWIKRHAVNHGRHEVDSRQQGSHELVTLALQPLVFESMNFTFLALAYSWQQQPGLLLIDSGSSRTLFNRSDLSYLGVAEPRQGNTLLSTGAGGGISLQKIDITALTIGQQQWPVAPVYASDLTVVVDFVSARTGMRVHGVIGQDFLQRHQALIDVSRQELVMKRPQLQ